LPFTTALRFGGDVPWESEPGLARICCPDPDNLVVFEIRRVEQRMCMARGAHIDDSKTWGLEANVRLR
jgi:hypothetical protein